MNEALIGGYLYPFPPQVARFLNGRVSGRQFDMRRLITITREPVTFEHQLNDLKRASAQFVRVFFAGLAAGMGEVEAVGAIFARDDDAGVLPDRAVVFAFAGGLQEVILLPLPLRRVI